VTEPGIYRFMPVYRDSSMSAAVKVTITLVDEMTRKIIIER
jgi:hypothetical protein